MVTLEQIKELPPQKRGEIRESLTAREWDLLLNDISFRVRKNQEEPRGPEAIWMMLTGRG